MSNDHYVPQSFLRAWSVDPGKKRVFRYQRIAATGLVAFGERSIRSLASHDDLYSISDGAERISFEKDIMSRAVDDPIAKALAKFRNEGLRSLSDDERDQLGRLVLTIEARNPETIQKMNLSQESLALILASVAKGASTSTVKEVTELLVRMRDSTGAMAAGMYSSWGYGPDLAMLKRKRWLQVDAPDEVHAFVSSNYPTMRGSVLPFEHDNHISSLAVSPARALVIAAPSKLDEFKRLPAPILVRMINLMTIAGAREAYTDSSRIDPWIEKHLGWATRVTKVERVAYFSAALLE